MKQDASKLCLVTGGNAGIGKATVQGLAELGHTVVMVCRNRAKGEEARSEIVERTGNESVHLLMADLSSQAQIRQMASRFGQRFDRLDALINNAGVLLSRRSVTEDGLETQFAVNHLAYFLLSNLLIDLLKKSAPSRIVNVSSGAHFGVDLKFDDLQSENDYNPIEVYSRTKLANVLFTRELARRLSGTGVTANCLSPGVVMTKMLDDYMGVRGARGKTPAQGAQTSIYLATSPEVAHVSGTYFSDKSARPASPQADDAAKAARLWKVSQELTELQQTI